MQIGDCEEIKIYGHLSLCEILAIHKAGTIDVMRLDDGKCFRVSGCKAYSDNPTRCSKTQHKAAR